MSVRFELLKTLAGGAARRGRLHTPHGTVETPFFMPVGTVGSVKTLGSEDVEALGYQQVLSNTYHLSLRPGADIIERFGGIHRFMGWNGAILTDSGGYQVMSLSKTRKITDEGVTFKSHLDGSLHFLSPERSIEIQGQLGVDISMCLDECPPYPCSREDAAAAMERTHAWAPRNLAAARDSQAVFGIVQGGVHEDLRQESAGVISGLPFAGVAIGGVSVGEPTEMQYPVVQFTAPLLPEGKARYLMGVGHPQDIVHAVRCGVDMFDCVLPTRMARHNVMYTLQGRVNMLNAKWSEEKDWPDPDSISPALLRYSPAYIRHLLRAKEPLGPRLLSLHNLWFYARLMGDLRLAIETDTWTEVQSKYQTA